MPPPLPPGAPPLPPEPPEPPPPPPDAAAPPKPAPFKMGGAKTAFKMGGSSKKMKTSLGGGKPGIFGAATDEPEEEPPATATALPRKALASGMPGSSLDHPSLAQAQAQAQAVQAAHVQAQQQVQAAVQAQLQAQAAQLTQQMTPMQAAASAAGQAAIGQMNAMQAATAAAAAAGQAAISGMAAPQLTSQAVAEAAKNAAAALAAVGIGAAGASGGITFNAVGRIEAVAGVAGFGSSASGMAPPPDESPDHGDDSVQPGPQRRGDYTFCRKYTRSRVKQVPECDGLKSIDTYENLGMVGKGAFNKIYKAKNRETGEIVALKSMQLDAGGVATGEGIPLEMVREMSIMMSIRHPNIVRVKEAVVDAGSMYMVMELVDFDLGLLIEHMKQPFSEGQVKCLAMQLLSALAAVHENFVLHRDLKQTNLLLDKNGVLKLCDFGLSRRCSGYGKPCTPTVTSLWYRAPEILLGDKTYGSAVDMWSFGCIFAEWLQLGEPLFQGQNEAAQIDVIFKLLGTPSEHSWPAFPTLPGVQLQVQPLPEVHVMTLGANGDLIRMPKNGLRKKFPAVGYTPNALNLQMHRTTALSEAGYELLNSALTCDPAQRVSALRALEAAWLSQEPLPVPLSRAEIRQLRRNRDDAINSGAHAMAIAQQKAQQNAAAAQASAAAIAASIKAKMGL